MVHLHVHSEYSLLDSIIRIPELVERSDKACAITDHGTIGGWVDLYSECRKQGKKSIFGCEFYHDKGNNYHLTVIAKNHRGFNNIIQMNNKAIDNFYKKPRITDTMLEEHREGLIILSGCMQGYMQQTVLSNNPDWEWYHWIKEVFGDDFYLEIQDNGIPEQKKIKNFYIDSGLRCVATVDAHYLDQKDSFAHRVSLGIMTNRPIYGKDPFTFNGQDYYLLSEQEMLSKFPLEAVEATDEIADKIEEFDIGHKDWMMPSVEVDDIVELENLRWELNDYLVVNEMSDDEQIYFDRLEYEFEVIRDNGFLPYFIIMSDLCSYTDSKGVFRGWGRGSASGSLVSFLYGITKIDPIKWGLYFERFLNPDRISPPDIDLDFMSDFRQEAIEYFSKFGEVYRIGSYGTLGTKETIRSCARIMGIKTDLDKYVPVEAPVPTIKELMQTKVFSRKASEHYDQFIDTLLKLEGLKRNASVHAAGIIISDGNIPLRKNITGVNAGVVSTAWDMYSLENLKYVKFDILGVKNLDILDRISKSVEVKIKDIPLDDKQTFDLIREGRTTGIFQWESEGFRDIIVRLKPDKFDELLDLNTLYRPGCLESGLTDQYIRRKHGDENVIPIHPKVKIEGQQGLPLYQEDIMKMAQDVAGFTPAEADILRKAIGKKIKSMFDDIKRKFIDGCQQNEIKHEEAMELWNIIEKFSRYTWNKAHSVAYTLISWWTAYFSTHYPAEFFCELLNMAGSIDRRRIIFAECRKRNIEFLHPNINKSGRDFKVMDGKILIGLSGIKYLGEKSLDAILEQQGDLTKDNIENKTGINKRIIEFLDKAGAFDYKPTIDEEKEALGLNVNRRFTDAYWWSSLMPELGEVIDIHKITTKKGDPMAFIKVEFEDDIRSITVFPDCWSALKEKVKVGSVGIFKVDGRGVLERSTPVDISRFKVYVQKPEEFISFHPSNGGEENIYYDGYGISSVKLDEELLEFIYNEFGIQKLTI